MKFGQRHTNVDTQTEVIMVDEQVIEQNHEKFMEYIKADDRSEQLLVMYEDFSEQLVIAPASGKVHYHNCFPGGYLDHVLHVVECGLRMASMYKQLGGTVNFTKQELIFSALHHDLGKLGNVGEPYYVEQDSDWHRKRGEYYTHNQSLGYMNVTDRALHLLQHYGIKVTENEWLSIKLSDGLYDESNKSYLKNYMPYPLHTSLPRLIHMADYMASTIENDKSRF